MGLNKIVFFCVIFILFNGTAYGFWEGPKEIIRASWGKENGEVGRENQYLGWRYPWLGAILYDDRLMINDSVNNRIVFYRPDGTIERVMPFEINQDGNIMVSDYYIHHVMAYTPEGIWDSCGDQYCLRDPLEGTIKERRGNCPLETDETIYKKHSGVILRDRNNFRYIVMAYTQNDYPTTSCFLTCHKVFKFNSCSKEMTEFNMPESRYKSTLPGEEDLPPEPIIAYTEPFVSYNGDIYCGVYQESHYSVLKWTWKDGPDDQNPGPDPPGYLRAASVPSGVKLTWTASAQDPGCVTGYEIARSTDPSGTYSTIDSAGAGVFAYEDGTAAKDVTYYYKVRAVAGDLYSEYTVSVRIPQG